MPKLAGQTLKIRHPEPVSKPRVRVKWNTGERVHQPKKGKGSYRRRPKNKKETTP